MVDIVDDIMSKFCMSVGTMLLNGFAEYFRLTNKQTGPTTTTSLNGFAEYFTD